MPGGTGPGQISPVRVQLSLSTDPAEGSVVLKYAPPLLVGSTYKLQVTVLHQEINDPEHMKYVIYKFSEDKEALANARKSKHDNNQDLPRTEMKLSIDLWSLNVFILFWRANVCVAF